MQIHLRAAITLRLLFPTLKKAAANRINLLYCVINIIRLHDYVWRAARYYYLLDGNRVTIRDTSSNKTRTPCQWTATHTHTNATTAIGAFLIGHPWQYDVPRVSFEMCILSPVRAMSLRTNELIGQRLIKWRVVVYTQGIALKSMRVFNLLSVVIH